MQNCTSSLMSLSELCLVLVDVILGQPDRVQAVRVRRPAQPDEDVRKK